MRVAVIGTVGVPANYGGFETLVENIIGNHASEDIAYTVFCSSKSYAQKQKTYKGAKLTYIHLKANGMQSIFYDAISMIKALPRHDVLLILGVSGCWILPFIRLFSRKQIIVNIDGLEHRRNKWTPAAKRFLKLSEKIAVHFAHQVITDNQAIKEYVSAEYGKDSAMIAYGGDHAQCDVTQIEDNVLSEYGLHKKEYSFSVCRIEPENHVHLILEAFAECGENLVFVGNWQNSEYGRNLLVRYSRYPHIKMVQAIYDIPVLNILRSNCKFYIHGHSAGGTNPSLVEAMFFGVPILAFDCVYNRYTTQGEASYFKDERELIELLKVPLPQLVNKGRMMQQIADRSYRWEIIAKQYEQLYKR